MNYITVEDYSKEHGKEKLLVEPNGDLFICRACKYNNNKIYMFRNNPDIIKAHINAVRHHRVHYRYIESLIYSHNNKQRIAELLKQNN